MHVVDLNFMGSFQTPLQSRDACRRFELYEVGPTNRHE